MKGPNEFNAGGRQESALSPSSTAEECADFAREFSDKIEHIQKMREQAVRAGSLPPEAGMPAFAPGETGLKKNRYSAKALFLKSDAKERLLPLFKIDTDGKKILLDIHEIGPETPVPASKIGDSLLTMREAIRHINGAADGKEKYPHVYAFLKVFLDYLEGVEVKAADEAKVREFLDTVEFNLPPHINAQVYKQAFNLPRIKGLMDVIFQNKPWPVKKDNFREWMNNFKPPNNGVAQLYECIKQILPERLRKAFVERLLGELQSPLPIEPPAVAQPPAIVDNGPVTKRYGASGTSPQKDIKSTQKNVREKITGPFRLAPSLPPPPAVLTRHSMHPLPLLRRRNDDGTGVARDAAIKAVLSNDPSPEEYLDPANTVVQTRIKDIIEPMVELVPDFFRFISNQRARGARFTNMQMLLICDLLFGDSIPWTSGDDIVWRETRDRGIKNVFVNSKKPRKEEQVFFVLLHKLRSKLAEKGCLDTPGKIEEARAEFVIAFRDHENKRG